MNKKFVLMITILALIAALGISGGSCGPSEPSQFVTYTDEANGFSIEYPDSWHVKTPKNPPELKVSIWEKEFGLNPVGLMVGKYAASGYSLEDFSEFRKNFLSENSGDYESISTEELTIDTIPALKHIYTETVGNTPYKSVDVCLVEDGTGWILRFNSSQKSFDSYKSIFNTSF
ncbi:unnamed protein product, partial [marine sediment metagenome]